MLTFDTFYPSDIHITDQTLLLNIETTGLSPRNAFVFMIGLGWQEEKGWHFQCLLAEKKMDERELMQSFQQILENFSIPGDGVLRSHGKGGALPRRRNIYDKPGRVETIVLEI